MALEGWSLPELDFAANYVRTSRGRQLLDLVITSTMFCQLAGNESSSSIGTDARRWLRSLTVTNRSRHIADFAKPTNLLVKGLNTSHEGSLSRTGSNFAKSQGGKINEIALAISLSKKSL